MRYPGALTTAAVRPARESIFAMQGEEPNGENPWQHLNDAKRRRMAAEDPDASPFASYPATFILIGISVIVYAAMTASGISPMSPTPQQLIRLGADFGPQTLGAHQYWRAVTSSFLHIGFLHLGFNMWCLWGLARLCEQLLGSFATASLYVLTGVGAALASLAWDPLRVSAGASGAIFGVAGALAMLLWKGDLGLTEESRRSLLGSVLRFAAVNLVFGLMAHIDNMAHLGGLVSGLGIGGALVMRRRENMFEPPVHIALGAALVLVALFVPLEKYRGSQLMAYSGAQALRAQQWKTAVARLEPAVRSAPRDVELRQMLGYALEKDSQDEKALEQLRAALAIDPNNADTQVMAGELLTEMKRYDEALPLLQKAAGSQGSGAEAHLDYARALIGKQQFAEAEKQLRLSLNLDPRQKEAHELLAYVLETRGQADAAGVERDAAAKLKD